MAALALSADQRHFVSAGRPVFVLGDTVWAAFTRAHDQEWSEHLRVRAAQGFNAVYLSVLPILHDRSTGDGEHWPFRLRPDGSQDFDAPDPRYFERARAMAAEAAAAGLVPHLVLLWCSYVPGSWAAELAPEAVMTAEQTEAYTALALATFGDLDPVWIVSGDDGFTSPEGAERYRAALRQLKRAAPGCLTTLHSSPDAVLPAALTDNPDLDFHAYQGGHRQDQRDLAGQLAERYAALPPRRPVVHLEPCYEGHGRAGGQGRYQAREVRTASWSGLLHGATAGLGYGAHGVWNWHRRGAPSGNTAFSGVPFDVEEARRFRGADDVALLRRIVEEYGLYGLAPRPDLLPAGAGRSRVAASPDLSVVAVHVPDPGPVDLAIDLSGRRAHAWSLEDRERLRPRLSAVPGGTRVEQPALLSDAVHLFTA
ncbi:DUF4038 domain-containing protein [Kitasatospora indigofera]|uniref:apiosidase-like domain-containing protein n=1 Tax=Kitasatospora indigofera TaxID=67307 RepID=UPI0036CC4133